MKGWTLAYLTRGENKKSLELIVGSSPYTQLYNLPFDENPSRVDSRMLSASPRHSPQLLLARPPEARQIGVYKPAMESSLGDSVTGLSHSPPMMEGPARRSGICPP